MSIWVLLGRSTYIHACDTLKVQAWSPIPCCLSESLLAHYGLLEDTYSSPDPGVPCYHVVCEASVDTYSVIHVKNILGVEKLI